MIISKNKINEISSLFHFHRENHKYLSISFLRKVAEELDFKLKLQKSTIHLIQEQSFAVIGFRRSTENIFIEFFHEDMIKNSRVVKNVLGRNGENINRIDIYCENDIDLELLEYIIHSSEMIKV